jgi:hypothetical protein
MMLEKYLQLLREVRSGNIPITDFHFQYSGNQEICDSNQQKRFHLITALMYDVQPTDEPLLQELFLQEIIRAEEDSFQGIGEGMFRSAALLARFKKPENVWLFTRAKHANFDTGCGFDYEFLISGGIDATYDFVNSSESKWKSMFYDTVGDTVEQCYISAEDFNSFEEHLQVQLDTNLDTIEKQITLAIELDEMDIVKEKVGQWKTNKQEWTIHDANSLIYFEKISGNTEGQIAANELALTLESRAFLKELLLNELCALYLKTGENLIAWERMQSRLSTAKRGDWLPETVVTLLFEIVCAFNSPDHHPVAVEAFARGMREIPLLPPAQLRPTLAQMAERAAIMMGNKAALEKVRKIFSPG